MSDKPTLSTDPLKECSGGRCFERKACQHDPCRAAMSDKPTQPTERPAVSKRLERRRRNAAYGGTVPRAFRFGWGYWIRNAERLGWL